MSSSLQILPSVCPLDCPDTCALHITVGGSLFGNAVVRIAPVNAASTATLIDSDLQAVT